MEFTFDLTQVWPTANLIIEKLMPVLYVVVGLGVGTWILRKVRAMF